MKIVKFEPGDATSYRVLFHRLDKSEREAIGGLDDGAVLFGFCAGDLRPMPTSVFQPYGMLDIGYYQGRMNHVAPWTTRAGLTVLAHLTNRPVLFDDALLAEWVADWQHQLQALI